MTWRVFWLGLAAAAVLFVANAPAQTLYGVRAVATTVIKVVWNADDISATNPLPVNVVAGGSTGSVTAPGTSGSQAQAVQGITGGVPLPIQGGNGTAVKTDGSATTQPVSAASLPLPTGAATAAGQAAQQGSVAPGTAAANSVLGGQVYSTTPPAPTNGQQVALQSDGAGNLKINNATLSPGASTATGQASELTALNTINTTLTAATPASQAGPALGAAAALGVVQQDGQADTLTASAASALTNAAYSTGWIPLDGYQSLLLQYTVVGTGNTVTYEFSNDTTTASSAYGFTTLNPYNNAAQSLDAGPSIGLLRLFPKQAKYFRARISTFGSGTVTAVVVRSAAPLPPVSSVVSLAPGTNTVGNVNLNSSSNIIGSVTHSVNGSPNGSFVFVSRVVSAAASTNSMLAKSSVGRVYKITGYNNAAALRWLKLYNKSSAPLPGTDTPFFQLPLPPGAFSFDAQDIGYGFNIGIGYAITTGAADNDNTAVTAGDILNLNVWYQ